MRVLCVAEKPSVAKQMVELLAAHSQTQTLNSFSKYNRVTEFTYRPKVNTLPSSIQLIVTSVAGHIMNYQFHSDYEGWGGFDLRELIRAPVVKVSPKDKTDIIRTLKHHSKNVDALWLWLDCDREGENIAAEVRTVCLSANKKLQVKRAVFSALTLPQVEHAIANLRDLDEMAASAVDARQEIDLRYGILFTRFQTNLIRTSSRRIPTLSYGPCQIPTLQLIVDRYLRHYTFQSSPYWYIEVLVTAESASSVNSNRSNSNTDLQLSLYDYEEDDKDGEDDCDSVPQFSVKRQRKSAQLIPSGGTTKPSITGTSAPTVFHWHRKRLYDEQSVKAIISTLLQSNTTITSKLHLFFNQHPTIVPDNDRNDPLTSYLSPVVPPSIDHLPDIDSISSSTSSSSTSTSTSSYPSSSHPSLSSSPTPIDPRLLAKPKHFTVVSVDEYPTSKWRPLPLTTITLQQHACKKLGLTSLEAMNIAESLYQNGYISYPRTETDSFPPEMDLKSILYQFSSMNAPPDTPSSVVALSTYKDYADQLLNQNKFTWPRSGKNNDQAHPPIHPLKPATNLNSYAEAKVYDYVVRHFLGVCSPDAKGVRTKATLQCGAEFFSGEGLAVTERNYLDICSWEYWSNKTIPKLQLGGTITPAVVRMRTGKTTGPALHTESSLLASMYKHSIGTDATMASHINTIRQRGYVFQGTVLPTPLGCALALSYRYLCHEAVDVAKRAVTERETDQVAKGRLTAQEMLARNVTELDYLFSTVSTQYSKSILLFALGMALDSDVQQQVMESLASASSTASTSFHNSNNPGTGGPSTTHSTSAARGRGRTSTGSSRSTTSTRGRKRKSNTS